MTKNSILTPKTFIKYFNRITPLEHTLSVSLFNAIKTFCARMCPGYGCLFLFTWAGLNRDKYKQYIYFSTHNCRRQRPNACSAPRFTDEYLNLRFQQCKLNCHLRSLETDKEGSETSRTDDCWKSYRSCYGWHQYIMAPCSTGPSRRSSLVLHSSNNCILKCTLVYGILAWIVLEAYFRTSRYFDIKNAVASRKAYIKKYHLRRYSFEFMVRHFYFSNALVE